MTLIHLDIGYRIEGPIAPTTLRLNLDYAILPPEPTVFVWDEAPGREPSAQRIWTAGAWFPRAE